MEYRPLGVAVVLGPYNFPLHLPGSHLVPTLLAGNAAIFKPSEFAPGTGACMAELWHAAGVPTDVLQIIHGDARVAQAAIDHSAIRGVLFTGSVQAGLAIHQRLAGRPEVLLALEMGGNNPLIAWPTASWDVEAAVDVVLVSAFITAGQRCSCARRLIVVEQSTEAADCFLERLIKRASTLSVGLPGDQPEPFIGPLVSARAANQVLGFQERLIEAGGVSRLVARRLERMRSVGVAGDCRTASEC